MKPVYAHIIHTLKIKINNSHIEIIYKTLEHLKLYN